MRSVFYFLLCLVGVFLLAIAWLTHLYVESVPRDVGTADRVVVVKSDRTLTLYSGDTALAEYSISLGANPEGPKIQEGDSRTPEGHYVLDWKNRESRYYRSIHISYPNDADRLRAQKMGVSPGGNIMIHGQRDGLGPLAPLTQLWDWTDGCIAVSDREMEEIWRAVPAGTPIEIKP